MEELVREKGGRLRLVRGSVNVLGWSHSLVAMQMD